MFHHTPSCHKDPYPGSVTRPGDLLVLARHYHGAAEVLLAAQQGSGAVAQLPGRFCALHALELYLNAFRSLKGEANESIRASHHDLSDPALSDALNLRDKTRAHLTALSKEREYLKARYAPDMVCDLSHPSRVVATLNEMRKKVEAHF